MIVPARFRTVMRPGMDAPPLTVGLVNNMPSAAAVAAERQFLALAGAAFPGRPVHLRRFTCLGAPPGGPVPDGCPERYDALADGRPVPDMLIVTGAEPAARALDGEPVWPGIAWLADWAAQHGVPVVWSCLAGHAAVCHLDGIERVRLPAKLSGLFVSQLAGRRDPVTAGLPARFAMPQSRLHGLPGDLLERRGYRVLARSAATGADMFAKQGAPFLFLQGHPEYEADTLMREYRRDVRQFLDGARPAPPALPQHYFSGAAEQSLLAFSARAVEERSAADAAEFDAILRGAVTAAAWQPPIARLIGNWLRDAAARGQAARQRCTERSAAAWTP